MSRWDVRACVVCDQQGLSLPVATRCRHNCSNAGFEDGNGPGAACWSHRFPVCGKDLLACLRPVAIRTSDARTGYAAIVKLVEDIAVLFEANRLTPEQVQGLVAAHGALRVRAVARRIGAKSAVGSALRIALGPPPRAQKHARSSEPKAKGRTRSADPKRVASLKELPADFARALDEWRETCRGIQQIKQERGVKNADNTTWRTIRDAEWLCIFLAGIGLQHWEEMASRHYLLFRLQHGVSIAATAFRFLKFVKSRHPRMTATFRRPVMPKRPVTERLTERDRVVKAVQAAVDAGDVPTALLLCLVGLYAQPLTHCRKLAVGDFRRRDGSVACKFNEIWVPLDRVTAKLLQRHLAQLGCSADAIDDQSEAGVCLFGESIFVLTGRIKRYISDPLPKLRLTAVANVIAQGILDRNGIHRSFGVSMPTIAEVERIFGWQLQSEVSRDTRAHRRRLLNGELIQS